LTDTVMRCVVLSTTIDTSATAGAARAMPASNGIKDGMALRIDQPPGVVQAWVEALHKDDR
jgi:hypothetical protein